MHINKGSLSAQSSEEHSEVRELNKNEYFVRCNIREESWTDGGLVPEANAAKEEYLDQCLYLLSEADRSIEAIQRTYIFDASATKSA